VENKSKTNITNTNTNSMVKGLTRVAGSAVVAALLVPAAAAGLRLRGGQAQADQPEDEAAGTLSAWPSSVSGEGGVATTLDDLPDHLLEAYPREFGKLITTNKKYRDLLRDKLIAKTKLVKQALAADKEFFHIYYDAPKEKDGPNYTRWNIKRVKHNAIYAARDRFLSEHSPDILSGEMRDSWYFGSDEMKNTFWQWFYSSDVYKSECKYVMKNIFMDQYKIDALREQACMEVIETDFIPTSRMRSPGPRGLCDAPEQPPFKSRKVTQDMSEIEAEDTLVWQLHDELRGMSPEDAMRGLISAVADYRRKHADIRICRDPIEFIRYHDYDGLGVWDDKLEGHYCAEKVMTPWEKDEDYQRKAYNALKEYEGFMKWYSQIRTNDQSRVGQIFSLVQDKIWEFEAKNPKASIEQIKEWFNGYPNKRHYNDLWLAFAKVSALMEQACLKPETMAGLSPIGSCDAQVEPPSKPGQRLMWSFHDELRGMSRRDATHRFIFSVAEFRRDFVSQWNPHSQTSDWYSDLMGPPKYGERPL